MFTKILAATEGQWATDNEALTRAGITEDGAKGCEGLLPGGEPVEQQQRQRLEQQRAQEEQAVQAAQAARAAQERDVAQAAQAAQGACDARAARARQAALAGEERGGRGERELRGGAPLLCARGARRVRARKHKWSMGWVGG